tara:strand:- start:3274 stop:3474 length:201 start_codon:yes stop_codon:yes gene_type:complete
MDSEKNSTNTSFKHKSENINNDDFKNKDKSNTNKKDSKIEFCSHDWYHKTKEGRAALDDLDSIYLY